MLLSIVLTPDGLSELIVWLTWIFLAYPEIHYRFRYFPFSRYHRKEPEVIADVPFRIEPDRELPLLILIKDAHRFPLFVESVSLLLEGNGLRQEQAVEIQENVCQPWWYRCVSIRSLAEWRGQNIRCDVFIRVRRKGRPYVIRNDNLPQCGHHAFDIHIASDPLPREEGWRYGDLHCHSHYTSDQVEFGAPPEYIAQAAQSMGLQFAAITDHSYDLDDFENDYLRNDPDLKKWKSFRQEVAAVNERYTDFHLIPGEEVTCRNAADRNVHCLVLNSATYVPGSGDGAEKWFRNRSELSLAEVMERKDADALALAAHPMDAVPWIEKVMIRRGSWMDADIRQEGLSGLQILNGSDNLAFRQGVEAWKAMLREGRRIYIYAGNDAHGNFNRYRQIQTPMIRISEKENHQRFGWARTCAFVDSKHTLLDAIRSGQCFITTGPFLNLSFTDRQGRSHPMGQSVTSGTAHVRALTTEEFGRELTVTLVRGIEGEDERTIAEAAGSVDVALEEERRGYLRAEVRTERGFFAMTNPIWFSKGH